MRFAVVLLSCASWIFVGCANNGAPKEIAPPSTPTPTTASPTFSVAAGTYTSEQKVVISDATPGSIIYYTTNGTATTSSPQYVAPVTVGTTETLTAVASAPGYLPSVVASALYSIAPPPPPVPSGVVRHGTLPMAGAHVYLFAANTTGYGKASVSLLDPAITGGSDSIGAYVTTGSDGGFSITGNYTCIPNTQVYLYASGGDSGSGNNLSSGLLAILGNCPGSGSFSATTGRITVNEVTTIAAAYAMAGFAKDAIHVSSSGTPLAQIGIANAFANASNLADLSTGTVLVATPVGNGIVPQSKIDTLADILAACVGSANAGTCSSLFEEATVDGTASGTQPGDTATAAINIAHHSGSNVAALFAIADKTFLPALINQPNDFTVVLCFTISSVNVEAVGTFGRHPVAIDGDGGVWITNNTPNQQGVFKLSSSGAMVSPPAGFIGGGLKSPASIAIDETGNAWIADDGAVVEFTNNGTPLSPPTGFVPGAFSLGSTIAIDAEGNAWLPYGQGVAEFSNHGSVLTVAPSPLGAGLGIGGIGIDEAGNIWGALPYGSTFFNEFSTSGTLVTPPTSGQFTCGASFLSEQQPEGIALDAQGNIWITSGQGVTKESKSAIPNCSGAGGGITPSFEGVGGDIAIDGDGNVWVVSGDQGFGILSEFSNAGDPISPSTGFKAESAKVIGIAPDGSGNLWATGTNFVPSGSYYSFNVLEFIGASAPTVTPISSGLKGNSLGTRP